MRYCKTCDQTKPLEEFIPRGTGYRSECRVCWGRRSKRHKDAHSNWLDSLKDFPCVDCRIKYPPYVMHWDHLPEYEKTMGLGVMRAKRLSRDKILNEIDKCELVCANCHAERTYSRLTTR